MFPKDKVARHISQNSPRGLSILSTLHNVTKIFEFAIRLALQEKVFWPDLQMSIKLIGMKDRELFFWDSGRDLFETYICKTDEIEFESMFSAAEIIAEGYDRALDVTQQIFRKFNWPSAPKSVLPEDQRRLLERRL